MTCIKKTKSYLHAASAKDEFRSSEKAILQALEMFGKTFGIVPLPTPGQGKRFTFESKPINSRIPLLGSDNVESALKRRKIDRTINVDIADSLQDFSYAPRTPALNANGVI